MHKARLLKLASLLEDDAKNPKGAQFDLNGWGETESLAKYTKLECSTAVCAIGLACVSGKFKRDGLEFEVDEAGLISPNIQTCGDIYPYSNKKYGWEAIEEFFNLTHRQAFKLFSDKHYHFKKGAKAERAVADRIREFVAAE